MYVYISSDQIFNRPKKCNAGISNRLKLEPTIANRGQPSLRSWPTTFPDSCAKIIAYKKC